MERCVYGRGGVRRATSHHSRLWIRKTVERKRNSCKKLGQKWFPSGSGMLLSYWTILPFQQQQYGKRVSY